MCSIVDHIVSRLGGFFGRCKVRDNWEDDVTYWNVALKLRDVWIFSEIEDHHREEPKEWGRRADWKVSRLVVPGEEMTSNTANEVECNELLDPVLLLQQERVEEQTDRVGEDVTNTAVEVQWKDQSLVLVVIRNRWLVKSTWIVENTLIRVYGGVLQDTTDTKQRPHQEHVQRRETKQVWFQVSQPFHRKQRLGFRRRLLTLVGVIQLLVFSVCWLQPRVVLTWRIQWSHAAFREGGRVRLSRLTVVLVTTL